MRRVLFDATDFVMRGYLKNNNKNYPGRGGTGVSGKIKYCKDHDGAQGRELSRPTTICCGKIPTTCWGQEVHSALVKSRRVRGAASRRVPRRQEHLLES